MRILVLKTLYFIIWPKGAPRKCDHIPCSTVPTICGPCRILRQEFTPLEHYIAQGQDAMNSPNMAFDERFYRMSYTLLSDSSALEHYVTEGLRAGFVPSGSLRPGGIFPAIIAQKLAQISEPAAVSTLSTLLGIGTADGFSVIAGTIRSTIEAARLSDDLLSLPNYPRSTRFAAPTFNTQVIERRGGEVNLPEPYLAKFVGAKVLPGRRFVITDDGRLLHELLGDERAGRFTNSLARTAVNI